jgi:FHA domain-containing protein
MIICPNCRAAHVQGTLFCEQCGSSLIGVLPVDETGAATPSGPASAAAGPVSLPDEALDSPPRAGSGESTGIMPPAPDDVVVAPAVSAVLANPLLVEPARPAEDDTPGTLPLPGTQERDTGRVTVGSVPTRLRVLVLNTGRLTDWIDDPVIHVGRTDRSANVFPNIDLETDGGHNAGVSRRHVRISRQPDGYYLEDLGSINGTFLNRRRLSPGNPTELKDGDEVRLGNIVLRVVLGGFQRTS